MLPVLPLLVLLLLVAAADMAAGILIGLAATTTTETDNHETAQLAGRAMSTNYDAYENYPIKYVSKSQGIYAPAAMAPSPSTPSALPFPRWALSCDNVYHSFRV